ncbi:MAG: GNAT family N-acetyltransferase [Dehalococcoidales bacterium]|nr:GNAT family N-acetyltransferase [Dehalococcoidales bacterium]
MTECDFDSTGNNIEQITGYEPRLIPDEGLSVRIRPINLNDSDAWIIFVNGLSPYSKFYRFHHIIKDVCAEDARPFCSIDYKNSFALIAELVKDSCFEIIAVGRYTRINESPNAEFAIVVDDDFQRRGIGVEIMKDLAKVAGKNGITTFEGYTLIENFEIINFLKKCGFDLRIIQRTGMRHISFSTDKMVGVRGFEPPTT